MNPECGKSKIKRIKQIKVQTMSSKTINKIVPKLRFPEFNDAGEWKQTTLGQIGELKNGINFSPDKKGRGILTVDVLNMFGQGIETKFDSLYRVDINAKDSLLKDNDILFVRSSLKREGVGWASLFKDYSEPVLFCGFLIRLRLSSLEITNPVFLLHFLRSDIGRNKIISLSGTAAITNISQDSLKEIPIPLPSNLEQQKIASCLSSLDELIAAENQKLETLKTHKKGLMQQLFPAEGETLPKLRFAEFRDKEGWEAKEFSKYIVLYRGSSPRPIQDYFTKSKEGVNWIKIGDTKSADNFIISQVEEKITPKGAEKSRKVSKGELILANSMSFGKTYQLAIDGFIYDGWFVLREYEKYFHKQFLLQLLNSDYMQNQYKKLSAGGIVQNISSDIVYKTILPHTSLPEQQKIAYCLSSLDERIAAQSQKTEALKVHKKGLMQGLFPNAEV